MPTDEDMAALVAERDDLVATLMRDGEIMSALHGIVADLRAERDILRDHLDAEQYGCPNCGVHRTCHELSAENERLKAVEIMSGENDGYGRVVSEMWDKMKGAEDRAQEAERELRDATAEIRRLGTIISGCPRCSAFAEQAGEALL